MKGAGERSSGRATVVGGAGKRGRRGAGGGASSAQRGWAVEGRFNRDTTTVCRRERTIFMNCMKYAKMRKKRMEDAGEAGDEL